MEATLKLQLKSNHNLATVLKKKVSSTLQATNDHKHKLKKALI